MSKEIEHVVSSGNVFADLEIDEPEEALAKADLAYKISQIITDRGWTQHQAADKLGVDQPKISALVRGRLSGFSIDRLTRFLNALDYDVTIAVTPKPAVRHHARTAVIEAIAANLRDTEKINVS